MPNPSTHRVNVAVAIRTPGSTQFGVIRVIDGDRVSIDLTTPIGLGAETTLRIELGPTMGTALCAATAGRTLVTALDEPARQLFRIAEVAGDDTERWTRWRDAIENGGTLSSFDGFSSVRERAPVSDVTEAQKRETLARIDARLAGSSGGRERSARSAAAEALRRAIRGKGELPEPEERTIEIAEKE